MLLFKFVMIFVYKRALLSTSMRALLSLNYWVHWPRWRVIACWFANCSLVHVSLSNYQNRML